MGIDELKVVHVVGARPNFMKAAPVIEAFGAEQAKQTLVHTGEHYGENMSRVFFDELGLPEPDVNLGVGSGTQAYQTGEVMKRIESVFTEEAPDIVLVYGDVNSTIAAALVAKKLHITVAHVEAGLRSGDRSMPEEINRVITDQISDLLFTHSPEADDNLRNEGVAPEAIHFVGNVMIDTLKRLLPKARERTIHGKLGLMAESGEIQPYMVATLHRPCNVDHSDRLARLMEILSDIGQEAPIILPLHPRTAARLEEEEGISVDREAVRIIEPLGYLDFLHLEAAARAVITDSGGIQEETTFLGVPCFTLRPNTERPITIHEGTNRLITDISRLPKAVREATTGKADAARTPQLWDGRAAERIAEVIIDWHEGADLE